MAVLSAEEIPEPDRAEGAPHPRETGLLVGQHSAEEAFLSAYNGGRMHHAWMLTGPRGVGKATLAWRIARFLLSQPEDDGGMFGAPPPPESLDADPNHPAVRRAMSLGEPRLFLCRRPWDDKAKPPRLKKEITVDEVRKLKSFFALSATDGGWRVAIVDDIDLMNVSAANALLKILEEPPEKTVLLLVSHQPARLLPTIRSRCRDLRCTALSPQDQSTALTAAGLEIGSDPAIAELSGGSVGAALRLAHGDGAQRYAALVALMEQAPGLDRGQATAIAEKCGGAANAENYDITVLLIDLLLTRLARFGALQPAIWTEAAPQEARMLAKLAPNCAAARKWANLAQALSARVGHARAVNLDPSGVILDMLLKLDEAARA
ncbi:DNA polymerase III subunit delta' [Neptunicoccus cionae]|uniref:DNA polymerase III subunit delta n=1 Tax=Neptunicoccus cionae TaxID=2035344 RepID=A0A916VN33_9RHOB|nr:DNA polymerase III subunit delta' [Amylibacter cionae]GGA10705.1 DNA polymerase III subunit delta' [Amylibacter cionae]